MAPNRTPFRAIRQARVPNHQLTPYEREIAIGMSRAGAKPIDIQIDLDISRGALRSTLSLQELRYQGETQTRSGPPVRYTEADERNLLRYVRKYPKDTYEQTRVTCN
jgi:hypothetical protein